MIQSAKYKHMQSADIHKLRDSDSLRLELSITRNQIHVHKLPKGTEA